ncbi:DTW domain-containing protein [Aestuariibacter sp. AA17]|uniref:tRNA-uridine aminocarboxypropyltransferase n=1 Tax=Fluctibacter corallii TaxID=2984329 RepID=A0ABT3AB58_9ALTE|nr:tRNA-uridine aminocarboxypropyltransferase [Aestuariibacter sp. AA17]MCV2885908.1 DTW domain-containing protein [Aestuariibacter sp. AA17]
MSRERCPSCDFLLQMCLCDVIHTINNHPKIIVLQHPKESKHAKNSVSVLKPCLTNIAVIEGESEQDFQSVQEDVQANPHQFALVYPSASSQAIEQLNTETRSVITHLIVIDATWRKAYKMLQLNPWLQHIQQLHFSHIPNSLYGIRKRPKDTYLSTLEAVAYSLQAGFNVNTTALLNAFAEFQQRTFAKHPSQQHKP